MEVKHATNWLCHKCTMPQITDTFCDLDLEEDDMICENEENVKNQLQRFKKGLTIGTLNINRLHPKLVQLSALLHLMKINILAVNETWLSDSIDCGEMKVPGYQILRQDRTMSNNAKNKTSGGGVALYINADINFTHMLDLNNPNLELDWDEINLPKQIISSWKYI